MENGMVASPPPMYHSKVYEETTAPLLFSHNATDVLNLNRLVLNYRVLQRAVEFELNFTMVGIDQDITSGIFYYDIQLNPVDTQSIEISSTHGLSLQTLTNETGTIIRIAFPSSSINLGSILTFSVSGRVNVVRNNDIFYLSPVLRLDSSASLCSISIYSPANYRILGLSPSAHQSSGDDEYNKRSWNYVDISAFSFNFTYLASENPSALAISLGNHKEEINQGEQLELDLSISYTDLMPIALELLFPSWFLIKNNNGSNKVVIPGQSEVVITLITHQDLAAGNYSGNILVMYRNQLVQKVAIGFEVKAPILSNIAIIVSLVGFLSLAAFQAYLTYKNRRQRKQSSEKDLESYVDQIIKVKTKIVAEQEMSVDYNFFKNVLSDREIDVLRFIEENTGTTQQNIANYFELSKATISRVLNSLTNRNLIVKERSGMSNRISINYDHIFSETTN